GAVGLPQLLHPPPLGAFKIGICNDRQGLLTVFTLPEGSGDIQSFLAQCSVGKREVDEPPQTPRWLPLPGKIRKRGEFGQKKDDRTLVLRLRANTAVLSRGYHQERDGIVGTWGKGDRWDITPAGKIITSPKCPGRPGRAGGC